MFSDDLTLPVESGEYKIRLFKDIQVTDDFFAIDERIRKCQSRKLFDECIKDSHVDSIRKSCGCLPLSLQLNKNVTVLIVNNCSKLRILGNNLFNISTGRLYFAKEFDKMQEV